MTVSPDLPARVRVDEFRLIQVLDNLIGNACKFTYAGVITLEIERVTPSAGAAAMGYCAVRFSLQDTGSGIPAKDLPSIFEPFTRVGQTRFLPGLGLGLSIARQWIRSMGSDIHVESEQGRGSRFWFVLELPVERNPQVVHSDCVSLCVVPQSIARHALLVLADAAENRDLLRKVCENWEYAVLTADSVEQAIALCDDVGRPVDALLVDQFIPELGVWELLSRVRARNRALPVILVSAYPAQRPAHCPAELEFDLVLDKPLNFERLGCFLCQRLNAFEAQRPPPCHLMQKEVRHTSADPDAFGKVPQTVDLERMRRLLYLGRVLQIADWARQLRFQDHSCAPFCDRVIALACAADLVGLGQLLRDAESALTRMAQQADITADDL